MQWLTISEGILGVAGHIHRRQDGEPGTEERLQARGNRISGMEKIVDLVAVGARQGGLGVVQLPGGQDDGQWGAKHEEVAHIKVQLDGPRVAGGAGASSPWRWSHQQSLRIQVGLYETLLVIQAGMASGERIMGIDVGGTGGIAAGIRCRARLAPVGAAQSLVGQQGAHRVAQHNDLAGEAVALLRFEEFVVDYVSGGHRLVDRLLELRRGHRQ